MEFKTGANAYYCNKPCIVLQDLGDEAFVQFNLGEVYENDGDSSYYVESLPEKVLVSKEYLSLNKIDLESEFKEHKRKIDEERSALNAEIRKSKSEALSEIKEIENRVAKYSGLNQYLDYLDGKIEYVVIYESYSRSCSFVIKKPDEIRDGEGWRKDLKAFIFRANRNDYSHIKDVTLFVNSYSDFSGNSANPAKACRTLEDAKDFVLSLLNDSNREICHRTLQSCKDWEISHPRLDKFEAEQREKKRLQNEKELSDLEKKMTAIKSKLNRAEVGE